MDNAALEQVAATSTRIVGAERHVHFARTNVEDAW